MPHITTNDGVTLHYTESGQGRPLVLLHGWTFSGQFFHRSVPTFAQHARVIVPDLRGHGDSQKPGHGYRVSRLARDLYDLLSALNLQDVTVLGWSLGCPIIWSYLELFGNERLSAAIFVEQTPRQYLAPDWKYAHAACYDDAGLARTQMQVELDTKNFDEQNLSQILHSPLPEDERRLFLAEMAKSPAQARNAIMADHTRYDWRDLLPTITLPSLVLVARQDAVFDWRGPASVGQSIPGAQTTFFEHSSHALFLDETDKFNQAVLAFMNGEEQP